MIEEQKVRTTVCSGACVFGVAIEWKAWARNSADVAAIPGAPPISGSRKKIQSRRLGLCDSYPNNCTVSSWNKQLADIGGSMRRVWLPTYAAPRCRINLRSSLSAHQMLAWIPEPNIRRGSQLT